MHIPPKNFTEVQHLKSKAHYITKAPISIHLITLGITLSSRRDLRSEKRVKKRKRVRVGMIDAVIHH